MTEAIEKEQLVAPAPSGGYHRRHSWPAGVPWYYRIGAVLARQVPTTLSYPVGIVIADIFYYLWHSKREAANRNYARVLGLTPEDQQVQRTTRRAFRNFGKNIVELLHVQGMELEKVRDLIHVEGAEHWWQAAKLGRGIIFASAHFGGMDMASALPLLYGYEMIAIAETQKPKLLMDWLMVCRARAGITLLTTKNSALTLLRALRRGQTVALVIDVGVANGNNRRSAQVSGVPVTFCGHDTIFPAGPAWLARWSGAPVVFGVAVRTPENRFQAHVLPPILAERTDDADRDVQVITQKLVSNLEHFVRRYPDQWYIFRDMWLQDSPATP